MLQDIGLAQPPRWLTRTFSLLERDDLTVDLRHLATLQKVRQTSGHFLRPWCTLLLPLRPIFVIDLNCLLLVVHSQLCMWCFYEQLSLCFPRRCSQLERYPLLWCWRVQRTRMRLAMRA